MHNLRMLLCVMGIMMLLCSSIAFADDVDAEIASDGITTQFDLSYVSKYVFRGFVVNDEMSIQPSLTLSSPSGFSFNWWSTIDGTNFADEKGNITEVDYTLDYAWGVDNRMNAGVINITYPNVNTEATSEIYVGTCFGGKVSPTVSCNYDIDEIRGAYFSFGLSRDCTVHFGKNKPVGLGLSARIGCGTANYNSGYFGVSEFCLNDLLLSVSIPIKSSDELTFVPFICYSAFIDDDLKQAVQGLGSDPTNLFVGFNCSSVF